MPDRVVNKETTMAKFFTLTGYHRVGGELSTITIDKVFQTRNSAAKAIAKYMNEVLKEAGYSSTVFPKDCTQGYCLSCFNHKDDRVELDIMEVAIPDIHAVVALNCDDRTVSIKTFPTKKEAKASIVKEALASGEMPYAEYIHVDSNGIVDVAESEVRKEEEYLTIDSAGGNYIGWSEIEINPFKPLDTNLF